MKIITWNCRGNFRTKYKAVWELKPDILVVQECEDPDVYPDNLGLHFSKYSKWIGDRHKGIGVFSDKYEIKVHPLHNKLYKYIVPFTIGKSNKVLIAVWAKTLPDNKYFYAKNTNLALEYYSKKGLLKNVFLVLGDFNDNVPWINRHGLLKNSKIKDPILYQKTVLEKISKGEKEIDMENDGTFWYHEKTLKLLEKKYGFRSVYHNFENELYNKYGHSIYGRGFEKHKTFFNNFGGWHIDYCFLSEEYFKKLKKLTVYTKEQWENWKLKYKISADHVPLIVDIN